MRHDPMERDALRRHTATASPAA